MRPGILAVRTANEYRGRDLMSYLALRHLFRAASARRDRWAIEIAPELTATRTSLPYRHNLVYKGARPLGDTKTIEYRELYLPGPTEMLAEAALLDACARADGVFARHPNVYSYVLSGAGERRGMVDPYFVWWKQRQAAIANAARSVPRGVVAYFDIKRFYDSVHQSLVSEAWAECCQNSELNRNWRMLGEKLISDYQRVMGREGGLIVGPMFAHVLGNLILRKLDRSLSAEFPGRYFRYVDDIAIVLDAHSLEHAKETLRRALPPGLRLHEDKTLELEANNWIRFAESFPAEAGSYFWAQFVGGLKYFVAAHSGKIPELRRVLVENGFRIPIRDYSRSVGELPYLERLAERFRRRRSVGYVFPKHPLDLLKLAQLARHEMQTRFDRVIAEKPRHGMLRKFQLQKLRYVATRLLYLGAPDRLLGNELAIEGVNELSDVNAIYKALRTSDVSELLAYSSSVAQSAAQILALSRTPLQCEVRAWRPELVSAWAVLKASGIQFSADSSIPFSTPLVEFASQSRREAAADPYFDEVFALSRGAVSKHQDLLQEAFDYDEEPVLDAIRLLRTSS